MSTYSCCLFCQHLLFVLFCKFRCIRCNIYIVFVLADLDFYNFCARSIDILSFTGLPFVIKKYSFYIFIHAFLLEIYVSVLQKCNTILLP